MNRSILFNFFFFNSERLYNYLLIVQLFLHFSVFIDVYVPVDNVTCYGIATLYLYNWKKKFNGNNVTHIETIKSDISIRFADSNQSNIHSCHIDDFKLYFIIYVAKWVNEIITAKRRLPKVNIKLHQSAPTRKAFVVILYETFFYSCNENKQIRKI